MSYSCPQCGGDFVERMSIGIAAARPRIPINAEMLRQVEELRVDQGTRCPSVESFESPALAWAMLDFEVSKLLVPGILNTSGFRKP